MENNDIIEEFKAISKIPRPSFHLDGMRGYLIKWCLENDWIYRQDTYGNALVIIGDENENNKNIIIQSHMDMVSTKTNNSK